MILHPSKIFFALLIALCTTLVPLHGQGFYKDLFVDAGVGLTKLAVPAAAESLHFSIEYISTENSSLSAGDWYIAVECRTVVSAIQSTESYQYTGNLGVLNGVAYSLTANWSTTASATGNTTIPKEFLLQQNYPNPFNPTTQIQFTLPAEGNVLLTVCNTLGELLATLVDESMPAGTHAVPWNGRTGKGEVLPSGVYLYHLRSGQCSGVKKMILLR
ncbi:MAG: FlgD immunoglobulin-like domain containing protein [bacterium]